MTTKMFDHIDVDIGTVVNNVFVVQQGTTSRGASIDGVNFTWTAAAYTNLAANTSYTIRARLFMRQPPDNAIPVAESLATVPTGP